MAGLQGDVEAGAGGGSAAGPGAHRSMEAGQGEALRPWAEVPIGCAWAVLGRCGGLWAVVEAGAWGLGLQRRPSTGDGDRGIRRGVVRTQSPSAVDPGAQA